VGNAISLNRAAAIAHRRQAEIDLVLDKLDAAIRDASSSLASSLARLAQRTSPAERPSRIRQRVQQWLRAVLRALADAMATGRDILRRALGDSIPQELLAEVLGHLEAKVVKPVQETLVFSNDLDEVTPGTPAWNASPLTPEQARERIGQIVLPPLDAQTLTRTWQGLPRQTVAAPLIDRLSSRLWTPAAKLQIESQLTAGLAAGETVEQLTQRIRSATGAMAWQARRIARTEGRRALERDHLNRTIAALGDMVQGIMIQAVMDDRTRPEHAARHGTIYRRQKDGSFRDKAGRQAPELPDAPNCRCTYVPVLAEPELDERSKAAYETATEALIPDLPTYEEVWDKADKRTRRRMIGASRYDAIERVAGVVDPTFALDGTGKLRSVEDLRKAGINELYDQRSRLLTRMGIYSPDYSLAERGMALDQAAASRVLARQDLPTQAAGQDVNVLFSHIGKSAGTDRITPTTSPKKIYQTIQKAVHAHAELVAAGADPTSARIALAEQIITVLENGQQRSVAAEAATYVFSGDTDRDMEAAAGLAANILNRLLPQVQLPPGKIQFDSNLWAGGWYDPADDSITIGTGYSSQVLTSLVHEMMHRYDYHTSGGQFTAGKEYARKMLGGVIQDAQGNEYQVRKNGKPGLYYYQNRRYDEGEGIEFPSTMIEQLIRNPAFVVSADPEGLLEWIRTLRKMNSSKS
jgi:SPP1 gp7 family putative phage head morphogenesis protein